MKQPIQIKVPRMICKMGLLYMKTPSRLFDTEAHKAVTIRFEDGSFQFSCYVILQIIKPHSANHHSKGLKHSCLYTTEVEEGGRKGRDESE